MADAVVNIPVAERPLGVGDPSGGSLTARGLTEFVVGPENHVVEPVIRDLLETQATIYNPLFLYGASGTGKSHLARGLAAAWKPPSAARRVIYVAAADFARELADAIEMQAVEDLRGRYRRAALLVVEDLGHLVEKDAAQEELVHTLDAILRGGGQVIVTASASPTKIRGLLPGLVGRLVAGLCLELAPPGPGARLEILRRLAILREVELADSALRILADGFPGSVPELMGAMTQLQVPAHDEQRPVDALAVRRFLAGRDSEGPQLAEIARKTARFFAMPLADLRGSSRRRPVVIARDVAMYMARVLSGASLEQIGRYFGGRDHTTVMHGCRKTENQAKTDPSIRQAIEHLQKAFPRGK